VRRVLVPVIEKVAEGTVDVDISLVRLSAADFVKWETKGNEGKAGTGGASTKP